MGDFQTLRLFKNCSTFLRVGLYYWFGIVIVRAVVLLFNCGSTIRHVTCMYVVLREFPQVL